MLSAAQAMQDMIKDSRNRWLMNLQDDNWKKEESLRITQCAPCVEGELRGYPSRWIAWSLDPSGGSGSNLNGNIWDPRSCHSHHLGKTSCLAVAYFHLNCQYMVPTVLFSVLERVPRKALKVAFGREGMEMSLEPLTDALVVAQAHAQYRPREC